MVVRGDGFRPGAPERARIRVAAGSRDSGTLANKRNKRLAGLETKIRKVVLLSLIVIADLVLFRMFAENDRPHSPKVFDPPAKTLWKPVGARAAGIHSHDIIPEPESFSAIHVDVANSDNVWVAAAPMFELDWVAEPSYFVGSGPTFDNEGNLYFSPFFYHGERVATVSLDAQTGERRWALPADSDRELSSPPFLLNDPDNPGKQIIYIASYTRAVALRPDGSVVWSTATGLRLPPLEPGKRPSTKVHSFNYHPTTDSLVTVSEAGELLAFGRQTGELLAPMGQLPGAPAVSDTGRRIIPGFLMDKVDLLMAEAFGKTEGGLSVFSVALRYIFGGGGLVTNYFSISPDSGRIYVAATAEDGEDGTEDGLSEMGAIYALDLMDDGDNGELGFRILHHATFQGGTGSAPALSADGRRVYVSDNIGNVIALDGELNEIWRVDVGQPLVASVSVAPENNELFAVTASDVFKLIDTGERGVIEWAGDLTGFDGYANVDKQFNALTATVTANGVVVAIAGGKSFSGANLMLQVGMGLLDRETGKLRYFAEGREDSLAVSVVTGDGSIYVAHSPLRRAVGKAMYPELTPDITGGIARYRPIRLDLLARDAICAAQARAANAITLDQATHMAAISTDIRQTKVLLKQAGNAIAKAIGDGDLTVEDGAELGDLLERGSVHLTPASLPKAVPDLAAACSMFD